MNTAAQTTTAAMTFDATHKPKRDNLSPAIAAMMDRAWYRNRANGFNVQFIAESGKLDEWSFNNRDRAEAFAFGLEKRGIASAFSG